MANIIKPKRSNTAAKVPNTTELTSGELGVNMADRKVYINNGTAVVQVGAGNLSGLGDVAITTPTNGQALTYNSTTSKWQNSTAGTGTVTSVGITAGTGVTVSNSPITTSGNIAVGLSTKLTAIENLSGAGFITQNGTGVIAGRTLQAGTGISIAHGNGSSQDPIITNSAPDQTVALTGAGATTITGTYPNFTITSVNTTYSTATSAVPGLIELAFDTAQTVAANSVTATASRTYGLQLNAAGQGVVNVPWTDTVYSLPAATSTIRGGIELGSDTQQTVAANAVSATASRSYALQVNAAGQGVVNVPWTDTNSGGTVTSVGGTGTVSGLTLTGTVTTSGNLTLGGTLAVTASNFASQTANTFLAAPNGAAGVPTFRAMVAADVPTLNQNTTGTAANVTGTVAIANGGTGQTTRQNAMDALAGAVTSGQYLRGNGTDVVMSAIQAADVPTLNQSTTGSAATLTTARTIQTNLASTSSASFNGSANITPGVTGTLPIGNGGTNATTAAGALTSLGALASTNPSYTGTLTGGTGVINIGSNQFYKDANGNIGLGMAPSGWGVGYKAIQGSADLSLGGRNTTRTATNCYYDGTSWRFTSTGFAALLETNNTNGSFSYSVSTASGTADAVVNFSTRIISDGGSTRMIGSLRIGSTGAPEGQLDYSAESDVRWLARGGRLDCVNTANSAWQTGVFRGLELRWRTANDASRLSMFSDGYVYLHDGAGSRGAAGYILTTPDNSLANAIRSAGYIEWQSNVGAIGVNYFNSDERLKKNIAPTQTTARATIDAISFKQFDWNEYTDQDNVHVDLGVIAQQLQQINPKFVNVMSDSTLGVNEPELMTYALKAIQELSAELAAVKQELAQMKGVA